jgi:hypothetical protein
MASMRGSLVVASLFSVLTVTAAEQPKPIIPPGTASISGRVIDANTKRPLANAIITLVSTSGPEELTSITDAEGRYVLEGVAAGFYRVSALLDGFGRFEAPRQSFMPLPGSVVVGVADGDVRRGVDLALAPGGTITGRVTNAEQKPVKDGVMLAMLIDDGGGVSFNGSSEVRTSERGEYTIRNLPAGRYRVSVRWTDPEMLRAKAGADPDFTYFPGTRQAHEALSLTLPPGGTLRGIDIRLLPSELVRFSGYVLRSASEGRIEAHVLLPNFALRTVSIAADDGAFEITHLKPGPLTFWARAATPDGFEAAWTELDLGTDMTGSILPMMPTAEIRGRVVMNDGTPRPEGLQVAAHLVDRDGARLDILARDSVDIAGDGTFHLRGVFGHRTLTVVGLTHEHMLDRVLQGRSEAKMLSLASGESVNDVTLVVRKR